jgi:phage FluMu protein Com
MADNANGGDAIEVVCPHCKRTFVGRLIAGAAERYRGFKCPHCKLFVPHARADHPDAVKR